MSRSQDLQKKEVNPEKKGVNKFFKRLFLGSKLDEKLINEILSGNTEGVGHFQHGDAKGGFIWDPWNGESPVNRPVNRIDAVIIKRKEE